MTPPDPRGRALGVLHAVARDATPLHAALAGALQGVAEGADRALVTAVVYGGLRWWPALDAALAARLSDADALPDAVRDALRAGAFERLVRGTPAHAAVHAWVEVVKGRPGPERRLAGLVNAVLRRVDLADVRDPAAAVGLTPALWLHLSEALGDRAAEAARAMLRPGPLWLTAHTADAARRLRADGAEVRAGPLPTSLAVRPGRPLEALAAFREGAVQPQNPSSAAVVAALGTVRGERVLDVGSGHGVKAAQLAGAGAQVVAVEHDARRARVGSANLARMGFSVTHVVADATHPLPVDPVDAALLDAPCTGTGTLRGHPEIKLRWRPDDPRASAVRQAAMLDAVAAAVRPGGRLVYAVCARGRPEGPEVVAAFLARTRGWRTAPVALPLRTVPAGDGVWILPDDGGLDGFFVARLERSSGPTPTSGRRPDHQPAGDPP